MNKTTTAATGLATLLAAYPLFLRKQCLTWGADADEVARAMPGDELLPAPDIQSTRAITIATGPEAIWPWLVQLGPGRGGAYTYDWIENLFGLNMHSADTILSQFQNLTPGDTLALGPNGPQMRVAIMEPPQVLVFAAQDGSWVWAFGLYPTDHGTRLVSRNRIATPNAPLPVRLFNTLVMEPGSWVMERKMLLGIKARAEHWAVSTRADEQDRTGRAAQAVEQSSAGTTNVT
ncbi:SRPBCC family protein [Nocardia sp. CS682]|uniref:SRPBCC family protein n=1 Tax=Nocardia sp. CS682 TaxID=1047172 RepID=UPI001F0F5A64|nr:SRPBCC family protein [Nocardia sp. CS682]